MDRDVSGMDLVKRGPAPIIQALLTQFRNAKPGSLNAQ